ncbi:MAG: PEGA domain-containing protein [Lentisphaeria bacterium]|nr:PEGA domain-containing protein [Lentisphaeria bacterium]
MRLRIDKGNNPGKVILLTDMIFTIGRELDNQFVINENGVSRHHCTISRIGKEWFVEDCNSVNGVLVNGGRITRGTALQPGDRITVFNHEFVFLDDLNDNPPPRVQNADVVSGESVEKTPVPWGKLLLLVVILAMVAFLAVKVFAPEEESGEKSPAVEVLPAEEPAVTPAENILPAASESLPQSGAVAPEAGHTPPQAVASAVTVAGSVLQPAAEESSSETQQRPAFSDVILVDSDPAGAEVYLDGELQAGLTPLLIRRLSRGRHSLELRKGGYENSMRTIMVPDIQPSRPVLLRQKSGTLLLQSNPPGAHVWKERQFLGVTPVLLEDLEAGSHELTLRGPACESKKVTAEVSSARGEKLVVELQSNLGHLEVTTQPANCKVYLQGSLMGFTSELPGQSKSRPLLLKNIIAGEQHMKIEHSSGFSLSGRIQIPRDQTVQKNIILRVPTHRVLLNSGESFSGILLEQNEQGDVVLEDLGRKAERFLKPQIKEFRLLSDPEIQEVMAAARKASGKDQELSGGRGDMLSINDLRRAMLNTPAEDFNRLNLGKVYSLVGRPTMILPESKGITVVMFTTSLRCQFANLSKDEIEEMNSDQKSNVSFQGTCAGIGKDGVLLLKNCVLLSEF